MSAEQVTRDARLVLLTRGNPSAWAVIPFVAGRVMRFRYEGSTVGQLGELLLRSFGAGDERVFAAAVMEDGVVTGHAVATVEVLLGERVGWVWQIEHDRFPVAGLAEQIQAELVAWARRRGLGRLVGIAARDALVRRYTEQGWRVGGRAMEYALEGGDHGEEGH